MNNISLFTKEVMASLVLATAFASTPSAAESKKSSAAQSPVSNTSHNICTSNSVISNARSRVFILVEGPEEANPNRLTYCENGVQKLSARTSTGRPQRDGGVYTPEGRWQIGDMARHRKSLTYNNASMPYAMRVHQGIFIHQGNTSRPFASHGCIRLDENNARDLFNMVRAQKRAGNQVDIIIRGTDPRR